MATRDHPARVALQPAHLTRRQQQSTAQLLSLISSFTRDSRLNPSSVQLLIEHGYLLPFTDPCEHCGHPMRLGTLRSAIDGVVWHCSYSRCCSRVTIRQFSWFADRGASIPAWFVLLRLLAVKCSFAQIAPEVGMCENTIREVWKELTDRMQLWLDAHIFDAEYVFGKREQLEIDEAYIKWKGVKHEWSWIDDESSQENGDWVFGMINRTATRCWILCVTYRTADSLCEPVYDVVEPGTTVFTDALGVYHNLAGTYHHYVINKKKEGFARHERKESGKDVHVHVNHIESLWSKVRDLARQRHINSSADAPRLCIEFMYRFYNPTLCDLLKLNVA